MKKFWPHRSESKGFNVRNLVRKYRLKSSKVNVPNNEITEQTLKDNNKRSFNVECKDNSVSNLSIKRIHWANRDFSEYKKVAWVYFFEEIFFVFCMFLVRGIVDKTKDITNSNVIPIRVQKVRLDNSNSPNEIVWYKFNFQWMFSWNILAINILFNYCAISLLRFTHIFSYHQNLFCKFLLLDQQKAFRH